MSEESWLDGIEDEALRIDPTVVRFKNLDDVAKSLIEAKAYGGRSIAFPGDEASDEQWAAWDAKMGEKVPGLVRTDSPGLWTTLGVPEDKTGYKTPDGINGMDDETISGMVDMSESIGHTGKQHGKMLEFMSGLAEVNADAQAEAREEHTQELKKEWGSAYDDNMSITDTMVAKFSGENMPLGDLNNPARIMLLNMAKSLSSDPQIFNQINNPSPRKTPAEMEQDIDDLRLKLRDKKITGPARKNLLKRYEGMYEELAKYS